MQANQLKTSVYFWLILAGILVGIGSLVDFGVRHSSYGPYYKVNLLANHEADPQIAVFGSSVGEVAIDARVLEKQTKRVAYNFCIDGTRFIQYNGLIKELNEHSNSCELVVLAETFFSLSATDKLTEPDRFLAHLGNDNIYSSLSFVDPSLGRKLRYIPFYKFVLMEQGYYKASAVGLLQVLKKQVVADSLKGFAPKDRSWETGLDEVNKTARTIDIQIDTITVKEYKKTIAQLRKKGRKVLIIIPPIHEDGLRLLPDLKVTRRTLASMQGDGVYFRDYSHSDMSQDKKYFYNNSHVNKLGASVFSARLAGTLDSILSKSSEPHSIH